MFNLNVWEVKFKADFILLPWYEGSLWLISDRMSQDTFNQRFRPSPRKKDRPNRYELSIIIGLVKLKRE